MPKIKVLNTSVSSENDAPDDIDNDELLPTQPATDDQRIGMGNDETVDSDSDVTGII